ncbi:sporulation protein YunB [Bacillus sp. AFS055030]|uniref:sporulation protein YunB n=1 Tax=Bacillus sp. AFS055030 TaxID=2033507 RepID=UPI0015D4FA0C|nr:sporulation protein YunB [Bacillus sp. AFS055030]
MKRFKYRRVPKRKLFVSKRKSFGGFKTGSTTKITQSIRNLFPNKFVVISIVLLFFSLYAFWEIDKILSPTILKYSEKQTKRIASLVINEAYESASKELQGQEIIIRDIDENGKAVISTNTYLINKIIGSTTKQVEENIRRVENGDISFLSLSKAEMEKMKADNDGFYLKVPIGVVTNTVLLGKLGPTIPVRFSVVGDAVANVTQEVKPFGFDNSVVEIIMNVEVNMNVIIPFSTKSTKVKVEVPIATEIIDGEVPNFIPFTQDTQQTPSTIKGKK